MERTTAFHPMTDRYHFDLNTCRADSGWAQVDTRQDASFYGTWTNPTTLETLSYCEGDITRERCGNDEEYVAHLRALAAWHTEREYWLGIDPAGVKNARERFEALGVSDLLH